MAALRKQNQEAEAERQYQRALQESQQQQRQQRAILQQQEEEEAAQIAMAASVSASHTAAAATAVAPALPSVPADDSIVSQLMAMGFGRNGCVRAAKATLNAGVEQAAEWVFANMEDGKHTYMTHVLRRSSATCHVPPVQRCLRLTELPRPLLCSGLQ